MMLSDAEVIAAFIALLGALATAAISGVIVVVGYLVQLAINKRTEVLKHSEEERLRLDTIVAAIGMLSTPAGQPPTATQCASMLFVLCKLGHLPFALKLTEQMWSSGEIQTAHAGWVLDSALRNGAADDIDCVATMLFDNSDKLLIAPQGYWWPPFLDKGNWNRTFSTYARERLLLTLLSIATKRDGATWGRDWLASIYVDFDSAARRDTDPALKAAASRAGIALLSLLDSQIELPGRGYRKVSELRQELTEFEEAASGISNALLDALDVLDQWAAKAAMEVTLDGETEVKKSNKEGSEEEAGRTHQEEEVRRKGDRREGA